MRSGIFRSVHFIEAVMSSAFRYCGNMFVGIFFLLMPTSNPKSERQTFKLSSRVGLKYARGYILTYMQLFKVSDVLAKSLHRLDLYYTLWLCGMDKQLWDGESF